MEEESPPLLAGPEGKGNAMVVILVGAPGSGKTTFCNDVMSSARRSWFRVCQDTIANGKVGTKLQCLKAVADALKDGKSIFIDRCNLEREQRAEFVKLGGAHTDVHAVVLDLPARLCISRSVKRTGHEGNLQGGKAAAVVNRMLQKKELPKLSEGFSRITFCQNESDVKESVNTYIALGPSDSLSSGCFGQKSMDNKVQVGIMKFLKKVETPRIEICDENNVMPYRSITEDFALRQESEETEPLPMELERENEDIRDAKGKGFLEKSNVGNLSCNNIHTLAFPSISTSDFQFNREKASDIIVECVADFLNKNDNVRLVLVDLSHKSHILALVRAKAAKKNIDSRKFFIFVGDITRLCSEGNIQCNVIANAANWRLKPGGGGVNAAIFSAAGEALEVATKERAETLKPGSAVAVHLPSTSPLYQREGVTHVIHVLGPNMNPLRPNCLKNDYVRGCQVLRDAYSSLFEKFSFISLPKKYPKGRDRDSQSDLMQGSGNDRPGHSVQEANRGDHYESERNKKCKELKSEHAMEDMPTVQHQNPEFRISEANATPARSSANPGGFTGASSVLDEKPQNCRKSSVGAKRAWGSWAQALHEIAMHPEKHKDVVIEISEDFVVLNDLYPKAKRHILVLSRLSGLDSLANVSRIHLPLLKKMHSAGLNWVQKFLSEDASFVFRLGYHLVPSLRQLHLHVISQDFDSTHLKNKKHWNSFNTPFFRDSSDVIDDIESNSFATLNDDDKSLSVELRCQRCRSAHPNIPRLKSHIGHCKASFPPSLLQGGRLVFASSKAVSEIK